MISQVGCTFAEKQIIMTEEIKTKLELAKLLEGKAFVESKAVLPIVIGQTISGATRVIDLAKVPHLLIAGATKQGKTTCVKAIIASALQAKGQSDLQILLIDPNRKEFTPMKAYADLLNLCEEMSERYSLFEKAAAQNIRQYNESCEKMPDILVVIDEYSDLVKKEYYDKDRLDIPKRMMECILLLAQRGGDAGIHLVLTTNRISKDVVTGLIKANIQTRIAFRVSSKEESIRIIDVPGAENLNGNGDMLLLSEGKLERIQGAF